ncbi:MAG: tRNA preQ1(34) S-adenosylmethionine ribosyltransferase-isomerase QueA [Gemmataceae bacterium]|nr:tRNA preQ1(34) S-adenosylmethionine ribosyltransferase-isomerase QueA [Gemmataceae bacterium]
MSASLIDYDLPPELIAQEPVEPRDAARLLVVDRSRRTLAHHHFRDLPRLLRAGDLLVLNDTRVVPARLLGHRQATGGKWEGLFLKELDAGCWEILCQSRGKLREGEVIAVAPPPDGGCPRSTAGQQPAAPPLTLTLVQRLGEGRWRVRPSQTAAPAVVLECYGHMPLPPYIRKGRAQPQDRDRYQTVYSARPGAVAAPTAGLHFTPALFEALRAGGIGWTYVTLHVGLGTFRPIETPDYRQHPMHAEWGELSEAAAHEIRSCRGRGARVVAVGTTSVRVLETAARDGDLHPWRGETSLYIYPPYRFRAVDALITNFHLPRTTLLLLVAAFAGVDLVQQAYQTAIAERYRFYSYGDAMLIL